MSAGIIGVDVEQRELMIAFLCCFWADVLLTGLGTESVLCLTQSSLTYSSALKNKYEHPGECL